jgi:hypothetical protein
LLTFRSISCSRGSVAVVIAALACLAAPVAGASAQTPVTTIDTGPSGPTNDPMPQFTFSSTPPGATFECRHYPTAADPPPAFASCTSPHPLLPAPLADGAWVFEVRAVPDGPPARADFTVDTIQPDTSIDSGPTGPTAVPAFTFSSRDPAASFECRRHRPGETPPEFAPCSSGAALSWVGDGEWIFEVRAVDPAGNRDTPESQVFTVDTIPPETTITGGPDDTTAATAVFLFSAPGAASFLCRLDGAAWQACGSPLTYPALSLGPHQFEVMAVDAAGNQDPTPAGHGWQVLKPGLVIPGTVAQATALARELAQMRRALAKVRLRTLARRRTILFRTYDALTAGTVGVRVRARVPRRGGGRRRVGVLVGKRQVPGAGRHRIGARVTKRGRRLARSRKSLPVELRLSFTDLAGRSLWATTNLTLRR